MLDNRLYNGLTLFIRNDIAFFSIIYLAASWMYCQSKYLHFYKEMFLFIIVINEEILFFH